MCCSGGAGLFHGEPPELPRQRHRDIGMIEDHPVVPPASVAIPMTNPGCFAGLGRPDLRGHRLWRPLAGQALSARALPPLCSGPGWLFWLSAVLRQSDDSQYNPLGWAMWMTGEVMLYRQREKDTKQIYEAVKGGRSHLPRSCARRLNC